MTGQYAQHAVVNGHPPGVMDFGNMFDWEYKDHCLAQAASCGHATDFFIGSGDAGNASTTARKAAHWAYRVIGRGEES